MTDFQAPSGFTDIVWCPAATQLALLLVGFRWNHRELGESIHDSIEQLFRDWPDEKKADLYARLAERVQDGMAYFSIRAAVLDCIRDNQQEFA